MPTGLTGRVVRPGDPGWDGARHGFGARFDYDAEVPRAIVYAQDVEDVQNAVRWARESGHPLRVRSGCHSYEAYSSLVDGGVIVDTSQLEAVRVDSRAAKPRARIGAGIDMLQLAEMLGASGASLPLATGPSVGLAGLVQGGGFGITSRKYGLTCDSLVRAQVVNANGEIQYASEEEDPDLFWALRGGGGGNFGIVTEFEFDVQPVNLVAAFNVRYRWEDFDAIVAAWQEWAHAVDWGMTSLLSLRVDGSVVLEGQFTPDGPEDLQRVGELLLPMIVGKGPVAVQYHVLPSVIAARMLFGVDPLNPSWAIHQHGDNQIFKSSSAVAPKPLPPEAIRILREFLESVPPLSAPPSQPSMVQLLGGGGKVAELAVDATAVVHRKAAMVVQYDGYWTAPQDGPATHKWVCDMRQTLLPYADGAYVNYHDADLGDGYLEAYYGANLPRLRQIKARVDPDYFFRFPQSIPPAEVGVA